MPFIDHLYWLAVEGKTVLRLLNSTNRLCCLPISTHIQVNLGINDLMTSYNDCKNLSYHISPPLLSHLHFVGNEVLQLVMHDVLA